MVLDLVAVSALGGQFLVDFAVPAQIGMMANEDDSSAAVKNDHFVMLGANGISYGLEDSVFGDVAFGNKGRRQV